MVALIPSTVIKYLRCQLCSMSPMRQKLPLAVYIRLDLYIPSTSIYLGEHFTGILSLVSPLDWKVRSIRIAG